MGLTLTFDRYSRVLWYFIQSRATEVIALQASPLLGAILGGCFDSDHSYQIYILLLGSFSLTAHIFMYNDYIEGEVDRLDNRRKENVFSMRGIIKEELAKVVFSLLAVALIALIMLGLKSVFLGVAIAVLGFLYTSSTFFGKQSPVVGTLNHFIGGILHFLLGYTTFHQFDRQGLFFSIFFGLVFAGGHLNHEVRDYVADQCSGIATSAVKFGRKTVFAASVSVFSAAYLSLIAMASFGLLPRYFILITFLWLAHLKWSHDASCFGLTYDTSKWLQKRYRLLFAFVGIALILSQVLVGE